MRGTAPLHRPAAATDDLLDFAEEDDEAAEFDDILPLGVRSLDSP